MIINEVQHFSKKSQMIELQRAGRGGDEVVVMAEVDRKGD
jgi:hypothetical protein